MTSNGGGALDKHTWHDLIVVVKEMDVEGIAVRSRKHMRIVKCYRRRATTAT